MVGVTDIFKIIWPFLRELVLGKDVTIGQTVEKKQWSKLLLLFLFTGSILVNVYFVPKSVKLSAQILKLQKKIKALEEVSSTGATPPETSEPPPAETKPQPEPEPATPVTEEKPHSSGTKTAHYNDLLSRMQQMQRETK